MPVQDSGSRASSTGKAREAALFTIEDVQLLIRRQLDDFREEIRGSLIKVLEGQDGGASRVSCESLGLEKREVCILGNSWNAVGAYRWLDRGYD